MERLGRFHRRSDLVIRFNAVDNQSATWTGRRTDVLYIRGHGRPAYMFVERAIPFDGVDRPLRVMLDFYRYDRPDLDAYDGVDYTEQVSEKNGFMSASYLDEAVVIRSRALLRAEGSRLIPSLGFVALVHVLEDPALAAHDKYIAGFGFSGWNGHPWAVEKRIVERWLASGALKRAGSRVDPRG